MSLFKKICKKNTDKPKVKLFETFTKLWVTILLFVGIIDLQLSYLLAFLGKTEIAESLSIAVVTEILGVSVAYIIRAHFDTRQERKQELNNRMFDAELEELENDKACKVDLEDPKPPRDYYEDPVDDDPKGVG